MDSPKLFGVSLLPDLQDPQIRDRDDSHSACYS